MLTRYRVGVAAVAMALALSACSATGGDDADNPTTLTVVTHDSFYLDEDLVDQFTAETGYEVVFSAPGDAGSLVNQLVLTKDSPLGDVAFGVDNAFAGRALDEGVFEAYSSPALPDSAQNAALPELTPIDRGDVCLNVDHAWFSERGLAEPATLDDLLAPEYQDLLVVTNPATSSPGLAFLLATISVHGDDWQQYWSDLKDNGVKVVDGWSTAYSTEFSGSEGRGPRPIVLSYASSPSAEVDEAGAARTGALLDTCFRQIEYAGVLGGAANPEGAQQFIDFLLSDDVQQTLPESMYMYPINDQVTLPESWAQHAPLAQDPHDLPVDEINEHRDDWIQEWDALMLG